MNHHRILLYIFVGLLCVCSLSCSRRAADPRPFQGYWMARVASDSTHEGYILSVRLDFYDTTVSIDGIANGLGSLCVLEDRAAPRTIVNNEVHSVRFIDDTTAEVEYLQVASGDLWGGVFNFHPADSSLTFTQMHLIKANGEEAVELPYSVDPGKVMFEQVAARPNYKDIPVYYVILELPDRIYYRNIIADETVAPPFGDMQLRCYYPATDRDVEITNDVGISPLSGNYNATIVDCWALPGEPGIAFIVWTGTPTHQSLALYRTAESDRLREVDFVTGRRSTPHADMSERIDQSEVATLYRTGNEVRAYDPSKGGEIRAYDLAGRRLR